MSATLFRVLRNTGYALAMLAAQAASAHAQNTVVVELYTSQGCSSCPAADRLLTDLRGVPGVLPLSMNVDYWDYLGWKDDLALASNSVRQRAYARAMRSRNVYTPQMMIDGKMDVIGSRRSQVASAIEAYRSEADKVVVSITDDGAGGYRVNAPATSGLSGETVIWLVGYDSDVTKNIGAGENRGRAVTYSNVVRAWSEATRWSGAVPLDLIVQRPAGTGGMAIIVQQGEVGPILGATNITY
jgi:hypothetical protein